MKSAPEQGFVLWLISVLEMVLRGVGTGEEYRFHEVLCFVFCGLFCLCGGTRNVRCDVATLSETQFDFGFVSFRDTVRFADCCLLAACRLLPLTYLTRCHCSLPQPFIALL